MSDCKDKDGIDIYMKRAKCITLLTNVLLQNSLASLEKLEATPLELVYVVHKVPFLGCYLPLSIVGVLISVKNYISLSRVYPGLPHVAVILIVALEVYIYSWTSAKQMGVLTCEENIKFDGASESWPVFRIEMTGILIKHGILQLLSLASVGGSGFITPDLYFHFSWLVAVLKMSVNNLLLRWPVHQGNKYGVDLWSWLKVRY